MEISAKCKLCGKRVSVLRITKDYYEEYINCIIPVVLYCEHCNVSHTAYVDLNKHEPVIDIGDKY